ncbi:MAG: glycoside hydrolase family 3 N-terminal domain-containing protein [Bacteroidota bacterium]
MKVTQCLISVFLYSVFLPAQPSHQLAQDQWVDSVLTNMSLEERVGQLFMLATYSNKDEREYQTVERLVREQHLGGLIFMQGTPESQLTLVNRYQQKAKVPLLMAQDAEWGPGMRLTNSPNYPRNMTLGAITDDSLLYQMGWQMGTELKRVGIGLNFAPVVDVNNNSRNPVINYRSFGENKFNVARKGIMLSQGMQDAGVLACAKHFPGHGDTDTDSHYGLPQITHDLTRLDTLELYPFVKLMDAGVQSVMIAHLHVPALDDKPNQATSLSRKVVYDLLRDSMGYDGLVFTDALNMAGVSAYAGPGEISLQAFLAGNDILLFPSSIPASARLIRNAIERGEISESDLNQRVRRILRAKYQIGLDAYVPLPKAGLEEAMNSPAHQLLRKQLYEAAITLAKNEHRIVPIRTLDQQKIAYVQIGGAANGVFVQTLKKYGEIQTFSLRRNATEGEKNQLLQRLLDFDLVITGVMGMSQRSSRNFGITQVTERFCREVGQSTAKSITVVFGNPYSLRSFGAEDVMLVAYEEEPEAQQAAATALFGGIRVTGRLPVTASEAFQEGQGEMIRQPVRFGFALPEEVGMDRYALNRIDSLANHYVDRMAMPGCQILVMRGDQIVYDKAFGRTEYGNRGQAVDPYLHTYDLASLTKVCATTLCAMRLTELGLLDLDAPLETYLPELKGSNKAELTARRLLQHNAGLPAWYPFYRETFSDINRGILDRRFYSYVPSRINHAQIAPALYGTPALKDTVMALIKAIPVKNTQRVRYSDLSMILLGLAIERISGRNLDELSQQWFFRPIGMNQTGYNPHKRNRVALCPPTEADTMWRHAIIQGYVHDPAAAILGGIAGNAGLFANIYDLAKLGLMLKARGIYGGEQFLRPETINYFTRKQLSYSRKGLGWDKPEYESSFPTSSFASSATYGHTGFTGTCFWIDPVSDLVFVFLANRTFPYASNRLLSRENVRIQIMDQIYASIYQYGKPELEK